MDLMVSTYEKYVAPALEKAPSNGVNGANGTNGVNGANGASHNGDLGSSAQYKRQVEEMMELVRDQRVKLAKEVENWCSERGVSQ